MAKKKRTTILLKSTQSGHTYVTRRSAGVEGKLRMKKYDPHVRKHVEYVERKAA